MPTIVTELNDIYNKLGGNVADIKPNSTTSDVLNAIEQVIENGGTNGLVVNYTEVEGSGGECTADKTYAEIKAAIASGKSVKAYLSQTEASGTYMDLTYVEGTYLTFAVISTAEDEIAVWYINHGNDDTAAITKAPLKTT